MVNIISIIRPIPNIAWLLLKPGYPLKTPLGKPLVVKGALKGQMIDQMQFVDDDGAAYLYFGQGNCNMVPNDDMISSIRPV